MIISAVTSPGPGARPRKLISRDDASPLAVVVGLSAPPVEGIPAPASPAGGFTQGHFPRILGGLGTAKLANDSVTYLLEQVNRVTPEQVGGFLYEQNLVSTPAGGQMEARRLINAMDGKLGGAILLGLRGGVVTFAIVDTFAPRWSFARKAIVAIIAGAIVAAAAFFGIQDTDPPVQAPTNAVRNGG